MAASSNSASFAGNEIKVFNFEKTAKKEKRKPRNQRPENLIRRAGGLKKRKDLKYSDFEPLYRLWSDYFKALLEHFDGRIADWILKTDYHGCLLQVHDAPNPSQVGLHGLVVHESKSTFQMITRKDRIIVISKENATFQFVLVGRVFTLFGNGMRKRPHLRGRKVKNATKIPFFLK